MKTEKTINTIEELVALALQPYNDETRYELVVNTRRVFDNPAAGEVWSQEEKVLRTAFKQSNHEAKPWAWLDTEEHKAWELRKPAEHLETFYSLYRSTGSWRRESYVLDPELGQQIEAVWTKKEKYGSLRMVGKLTLAGICKRLGRTDIGEQVKAAKTAAEARDALNARNYNRKQVAEAVTKLEQAIASARTVKVEAPTLDSMMSALDRLKRDMINGVENADEAAA